MAPAAPAGDAAAPAADAMAPAAPAADANATASGTDTAAPATTAAIDRSTLTALNTGEIRTEELVGTTVYGADDANVGEIGDILLSADGKVDAYVVDVGGFLGMGEKEVAVAADNLSFMTDANGNRYLFTNFSKEQLEGQAAYDKDTYADTRDNQRLIYKQ